MPPPDGSDSSIWGDSHTFCLMSGAVLQRAIMGTVCQNASPQHGWHFPACPDEKCLIRRRSQGADLTERPTRLQQELFLRMPVINWSGFCRHSRQTIFLCTVCPWWGYRWLSHLVPAFKKMWVVGLEPGRSLDPAFMFFLSILLTDAPFPLLTFSSPFFPSVELGCPPLVLLLGFIFPCSWGLADAASVSTTSIRRNELGGRMACFLHIINRDPISRLLLCCAHMAHITCQYASTVNNCHTASSKVSLRDLKIKVFPW